MGDKGSRQTKAEAAMAAQLCSSLAPLGNVTTKKMGGGHGVFEEGVLFALIDAGGTAFLRAADATAADHEADGSERHGRMPYWTIPQAVLADEDALPAWAGRALEVAHSASR